MAEKRTSRTDQAPVIVYYRRDLRTVDHPALTAALATGRPVLPLFVIDPRGQWATGGAARWWLHHSLVDLANSLRALGLHLVLRRGAGDAIVPALAQEVGAHAVYWNRGYAPSSLRRDAAVADALRSQGVEPREFHGDLLAEPWNFRSTSGGGFRVFTPFARAMLAQIAVPAPKPAPAKRRAGKPLAPGDDLADWALLPHKPDWAGGLRASWTPGATFAQKRLAGFVAGALDDYPQRRDFPGEDGTSRLSASLQWGELSPRQAWHAASGDSSGAVAYRRQILWREFCHHLLYHFPDMPTEPLDRAFRRFPWRDDAGALQAWQRGMTGYPIVDAGMRQLWQTGWMHNRVRMVVGSFLVKHLLLPWQSGESWFWDTLVDASLANNAAGWQWVAGCGADAAPYFRIFNPVLQGERFDPDGAYVRHYVPELANLPDSCLHKPWQAPAHVLADAGVELGRTYPKPLVDHREARARALAAYQEMRGTAPASLL